ncbi:MAG: MFS transporter, partial [Planctomycetota bacterium]
MKTLNTKLEKSFYWLNTAQFFGALNDNVFKLLIIAFIIGRQGDESASGVTATAGAVFVVPFLIFSALAGKLADRFSKRDITIAIKVAEVLVMSLGLAAFLSGQPWALYLVLFLMASQSAFFSPSKYGILPELAQRDQLSHANSLIEGFTYLAVVIG